MLLARVPQLSVEPVVHDGKAAVETVGVVLGGQTPRRGEIGHFQIGSLSSSRTISSGMGPSSARTNESHASSSKWRT